MTFQAFIVFGQLGRRGGEEQKPIGSSLHGTVRNDLLLLDYVQIALSTSDDKYIFMMRDDHYDYKCHFAFPGTSAKNVAMRIIDRAAAFGVSIGLLFDGSTHFRNETVYLVAKGLKVHHRFALHYSPWCNSVVV